MSKEGFLKDKKALVTGASRGIGQGIALALAREGAIVIGTATTQEGADRIKQNFQAAQLDGHGMVLNVSNKESVEKLINDVKERVNTIDILVNNAGIAQDNLFMRMKDEEWLQVLETNLTSVFRLSKAFIRDMLKTRWGRIISIGSVVGSMGNPGQANYCAAKAGIVGFSKSLALEIASRDITVNTVAPGFIETDMTKSLTEEQRQAIFDRIPIHRMGTVEEVAAAVVFLASPKAAYITGQTLHVNGGMYMN